MEWLDWLAHGGRYLTITVALLTALLAAGHAVVRKRDSRSALLWIVVIWLLPMIGPALYVLLGINRIERRATALRREDARAQSAPRENPSVPPTDDGAAPEALRPLSNLIGQLVRRPLLPGNRIELLVDGAEAYPAMLQAIEEARESIALASYIFDLKGIGEQFVDALGRAVKRGLEVRVLLDDADVRFSMGSAARALRAAGIPVGVFNPPLVPARFHAAHLRNHSKILVADGRIGFTGGMNIATEYWRPDDSAGECSRDLHFRLRGPVVAHLMGVFAADWQFATDEPLAGEKWFPPLVACGPMAARGIESGPDENFERLRWAIHGALAVARKSVRIITPYFLPDSALISALCVASMRGVQVDILLPERNDLPHVRWASNAQLWQVLERGCRVWLTPPPFDHSKLLVVDGEWILFGSANWDARSLRLNFEFNVECYSAELGQRLETLVHTKRAAARRITLEEMDARPLPVKLRDGIARLFAPYL